MYVFNPALTFCGTLLLHCTVASSFYKTNSEAFVPKLPTIATKDDINSGSCLKPYFTYVSDYLNENLPDTIYDQEPLKDVMQAVKELDESKKKEFADKQDEGLNKMIQSLQREREAYIKKTYSIIREYEEKLVRDAKAIVKEGRPSGIGADNQESKEQKSPQRSTLKSTPKKKSSMMEKKRRRNQKEFALYNKQIANATQRSRQSSTEASSAQKVFSFIVMNILLIVVPVFAGIYLVTLVTYCCDSE